MAGPYTCSSGEDPELRIQKALPPLLPGLHHLKPTKRLAVRCLKDTHALLCEGVERMVHTLQQTATNY